LKLLKALKLHLSFVFVITMYVGQRETNAQQRLNWTPVSGAERR
jgi:hypothetical protein